MHYDFFETPQTLADWVQRSQAHQAWATRVMTEAFRRDRRMHSFAIHLFIEHFPQRLDEGDHGLRAGPKPAWFAYREALTPLAVNLRTDRRAFFAGEPIELEAWVCNDRQRAPCLNATLHYQLEQDGKVLQAGTSPAEVPVLDSAYQGTLPFRAPDVASRTQVTVRLGLLDAGGKVLHDTAPDVDVFPRDEAALRRVYVVGGARGQGGSTGRRSWRRSRSSTARWRPAMPSSSTILQPSARSKPAIAEAVRAGAHAVFLELPEGKHQIARTEVAVGGTPTGCTSSPGPRDTGSSKAFNPRTSSSGTMPGWIIPRRC